MFFPGRSILNAVGFLATVYVVSGILQARTLSSVWEPWSFFEMWFSCSLLPASRKAGRNSV